jgi:hypothetical protein
LFPVGTFRFKKELIFNAPDSRSEWSFNRPVAHRLELMA